MGADARRCGLPRNTWAGGREVGLGTAVPQSFLHRVTSLALEILFQVLWRKELIVTPAASSDILPHRSRPLDFPSSSALAKPIKKTMIDQGNYSLL